MQRLFSHIHIEENGGTSKRIRGNETYNEETAEAHKAKTKSDGTIDIDLKYIELRLGNVCNVKYRTCGAHSSSVWEKEHKQLLDKYSWAQGYEPEINYNWIEDEGFWRELHDVAPTPKRYYINGGEPLLIKKHLDHLKKNVSAGESKNISLTYSTNMTRPFGDFLEVWKDFKSIEICASIDDLEKRNEYIRKPTKWDTVLKH
jgi:hypothetical protein